MQSVLPWVGVVILFLTGWAIIKKYQVNITAVQNENKLKSRARGLS